MSFWLSKSTFMMIRSLKSGSAESLSRIGFCWAQVGHQLAQMWTRMGLPSFRAAAKAAWSKVAVVAARAIAGLARVARATRAKRRESMVDSLWDGGADVGFTTQGRWTLRHDARKDRAKEGWGRPGWRPCRCWLPSRWRLREPRSPCGGRASVPPSLGHSRRTIMCPPPDNVPEPSALQLGKVKLLHQRNARWPAREPTPAMTLAAMLYQTATNNGLSSVQLSA